jgi:lactoylglutathione lyase
MYSHVFMAVANFDRAFGFYRALFSVLGIDERFFDAERPWAGWHSPGGVRPLFVIGMPHDHQQHHPGNGQVVVFKASSRTLVKRAYETALAAGGRCEGPPGLRPQYHADYYGAYFRDTEGNKLAVACHEPEPALTEP